MSDMISRMDAIQACQVGPSDEWSGDTKSGYYQAATDCQMNILRIRALPSVGVKPLEWRKDTMPSSAPQRYKATTHGGFGDYSVTGYHHEDEWQWFRNGYFVDGHQHHAAMAFEAAKAAAQADYEARIMAALDVQPAPIPLANWRDPKQWAAAAEYLTSQPAPDVAQLRARVTAAIFDPGATEGYKGDRSLTQWQVDAVMRALIPTPAPSPGKGGA